MPKIIDQSVVPTTDTPQAGHVPSTPSALADDGAMPQRLKPYVAHRVDLHWQPGGTHATATCPFCGKDGKFSVDVDTGQWRCFVCATGTSAGGGNVYTFLKALWDASPCPLDAAAELAASRGLLHASTVEAWGWRVSITSGEWILPGYNPEGKLCQLYRWTKDYTSGKYFLLATTKPDPNTLNHGLMMPTEERVIRANSTRVVFFEGPWDGMAAWEVMRASRYLAGAEGSPPEMTGSPEISLLAETDVAAVPGANVFRDDWAKACKGKTSVLMYDNDHPNDHGKRPGYDGAMRAAATLAAHESPVYYLAWGGAEGHNQNLPSGYDVRDALREHATLKERIDALHSVFLMTTPYTGEAASLSARMGSEIECVPCESWDKVLAAWKKAMRLRQSLEDVLAVMLAVGASTSQSGDQLFLQVIGDAGSGKTRFCNGMLTAVKKCYALEHLTGFHSGWKGENGEDCSLIARINHMTLITPEADIIMSSPRFDEIMSQQRRIFDGAAGATYKNSSEDKRYTGLRTPWIMAGTMALLDKDQSRLGDRFLRVFIDPPDEHEKLEILMSVGDSAIRSILQTSNGTAGSCVDEHQREAYALTGGYINYLRDNAGELISRVLYDRDSLLHECASLADFTADLRARPNMDKRKQETHDSKELPSRLQHQYVRLAFCLAVVLGRKSIDREVMRRVTKVAFDTSRGKTLEIVNMLASPNVRDRDQRPYQLTGGLTLERLALWLNSTDDATAAYLGFLAKIRVMVLVPGVHSKGHWKLTDRVYNTYLKIQENARA